MYQETGSSQEVRSLLELFSASPTTCVHFPLETATPLLILGRDCHCKIPQMQSSPEWELLTLCHRFSTRESAPGAGSQAALLPQGPVRAQASLHMWPVGGDSSGVQEKGQGQGQQLVAEGEAEPGEQARWGST